MLGERPGIFEPAVIWKGFSNSVKVFRVFPADVYWVFLITELPAREYVVCGFEADNFEQLNASALGKAMKHTRFWLKEHGLIADGFFTEIYYHNSFEIAYMEMWIPFKQRENINKK